MKTIGSVLRKYRKAKGMSQLQLGEELRKAGFHAQRSTLSAWEKDVALPNLNTFFMICKIYGITNIYDEFIGTFHPDDPLSCLNEEGRKKVLSYIDDLSASGRYEKEDTAILPPSRTIRLFHLPASAGSGEFLDSDDFDTIQVGKEVPDCADFGIRIHGDSMEPRFINGQIVWVEKKEDLANGEIGIFFLDGNAYCKKLSRDRQGDVSLISINPAYDPMPISADSDFRVFGRVVGS